MMTLRTKSMMGKFLSVQNITFCAAKRQRSILKFEMTLSSNMIRWLDYILILGHLQVRKSAIIAKTLAKLDLKVC